MDISDLEDDCWNEVELSSPRKEPAPEPAEVDFGALSDAYALTMRRAKATASALAAMGDECFDPLPGAPLETVHLSVLRDDVLRPMGTGSVCTVRARGVVRGRPERYAHAARDCWDKTRLEWDTQLSAVTQHETYGSVHYATARVSMPSVNLGIGVHVNDRWVHGLVSFDHHRSSGVYRVLFRSAQHPVWSANAPERTTPAQVLAALYVCATGEGMCDLTVIVDVLDAPVGSWFGALAQERLYEAMRLWVYAMEGAVIEWDHYYGRLGRDPQRKD